MNYLAAVTDFFKSPKWLMNLLLAAICCYIPIVGGMVVLGWLITGFYLRQDESPERFPDFDFSNFGVWLQRGLWPVLVAFAAVAAIAIVIVIFNGVLSFVGNQGTLLGLLTMLLMAGVNLILMFVLMFVIKPLLLKAIFVQDFVPAFDLDFAKRFISLVWMEMLIAALFLSVASFAITVAGLLAVCVGVLLTPPLTAYVAMHLDKQLYKLYLSRGGPPLTMSPKLTAGPSAPPPAAPPPSAPAA